MRAFFMTAMLVLTGTTMADAPPAGPAEAPCLLTFRVPVGGTLLANGARTAQMTEMRRFLSPKLPAGKTFYYQFELYYLNNGEWVTKKKEVAVKAGGDVKLDFADVQAVKVPEVKKEEPKLKVFPNDK